MARFNNLGIILNTKVKERIKVTKDGEIEITCPNCNLSKIFSIKKYIKHSKTVRVRIRCKCGFTKSALLERREAYRKKASFIGCYVNNDIDKKLEIKVINLSANGIRFKINGVSKYKFKPGDKLTIEFKLNEMSTSSIQKKVIIRNFQNSSISAEFIEKTFSNKDIPLKIFLFS